MLFFVPPDVASASPLPFPHPVITEVLYAVPTKGGDANRDGTRDSAGDEFVELINPHDRPINLKGYSVTDSGEGKGRFKFTFPDVTVEPGQVVVVFNGSDARMKGAFGTAKAAPETGNPIFHGALVFDAHSPSSRASWANKSDYALLVAPNGSPVECVYWGEEKKPPSNCPLCEEAPAVTHGSVQRARLQTGKEEEAAKEGAPKPASTSKPATPPNTPKEPARPGAKDAGEKEPDPNLHKKRQEGTNRKPYTRRSEKPQEKREEALRKLTFEPFEAHPLVPATLAWKLPAGEDESGILFSPGLYPLEAVKPASAEDEGKAPTEQGTGAQGPKPRPPGESERPNTGEPR